VEHRSETRVSSILPVVVHGTDTFGRPFTTHADAINVSDSGTRISGLHVTLTPGARIEVESQGRKTSYLVEWIGAEHTLQDGQIGARCLDLNAGPASMPGSYEHNEMPMSAGAQASVEERRRFPRKVCRIETQVTTEDESVRLPGKVTDISLDGCYIEMMSPLPSSTIIHILLALDGETIMTTGIVRYSQMGLGMGVEFMAMNPEDFERLRSFAPTGTTPLGQNAPAAPTHHSQTTTVVAHTVNERHLVPPASCGGTVDVAEIVSHLPSTAEALEVVIRVLSKKGLITRDELCRELDSLKNARN
jgi:hypothetical protein